MAERGGQQRYCRAGALYPLSFLNLLYVEGRSEPDTVAAFEITTQLVQPLVDTINSGLTTLVPIGIGIM